MNAPFLQQDRLGWTGNTGVIEILMQGWQDGSCQLRKATPRLAQLCYGTPPTGGGMSESTGPLKKTPLNEAEKELGGRMVDFGGWELPVQYTGILDEHEAVRTNVGVFDVSHMGEITVTGPGALELLQRSEERRVGKECR